MDPGPIVGEEMILCPYESAHHVRKSRIEYHLKKCRKAHPSAKLATCDFNITHKVPPAELQYHHKFCPDRLQVEMQYYFSTTNSEIPQCRPAQNAVVPLDDTWEIAATPCYIAAKVCENKPVLRIVNTESASVRKNFRLQERQRLHVLEQSESVHQSSSSNKKDSRRIASGKSPSEILPPVPALHSIDTEQTPDGINKLLKTLSVAPKIPGTKEKYTKQ